MSETMPVAGWYVAPDDPDLIEYWDGTEWTGHRARRVEPEPIAAAPAATSSPSAALPPPVAPTPNLPPPSPTVVDLGAQEVLPGGTAAPAPVSVPDTAAAPATKKRRFDPPKIVWIGLAGSALVIGIIVGVLSR
ncbi:MAG TPA: hypothetical protein DHW34_00010 [Actinobacteria bacterium]|nr:hypothetical protein [Actinomycetota bacterium]